MKDKQKKQEMNENQERPIDEEVEVKKEGKKEEKLNDEIVSLRKEVEAWKEKAYRTVADADNLRKSYEKDHENLLKYRGMGFVEKLLPVLDSFHLSLSSKPTNPELLNYVKGFEMIYRQMLTALEQEGVKEIAPEIGTEFDPQTMQAIDVQSGEDDNKVIKVYSNGYLLKDRLVRPAMVVVSKKDLGQKDEQEAQ